MATQFLDGGPVGEKQVEAELLSVWDQFSPLNLIELKRAYDKGHSLDKVGVSADEAEGFVNKYNSIIRRKPGNRNLVRPSEARKWVATAMNKIVAEVAKRAK